MGKFSALALLLWSLCACTSTGRTDCVPISELEARLNALEPLDWRAVHPEHLATWGIARSAGSIARDDVFFQQIGNVGADDYCNCCETLVFSRNGGGRHLEAIGAIRRVLTGDEALDGANALIRAAMAERTDAAALLTATQPSASLGWTDTGRDTVLDVKVFQRGDGWMINIYWARHYTDTSPSDLP